MGNQNTSGIIEEENEAADNAQGVDLQENAAEDEAAKIPPVERLASDDEDIEDHKGSFKGSDGVMDISTNGSDLGEGRSKLSDEEQDQPFTLTDIQEEQNMLMKEALEIDDHDAKKNDDEELVMADAAFSLEGAFLEALGRDNEPPQEEQSDSFNTVNEASRTSLLDSSTAENEHKNECFAILDHEEKPMIHDLGNADANSTSQDQPSDQEISHFLISCSSDPMEAVKAESDETGDGLLEDSEKQEDSEPADHNVLEKALHLESGNEHETEVETTEKCVMELQSSTKIDTQCLSNKTAEAETPPISNETESNPSCIGAQVELRKSPSFDFGISFDTRSEESDQTPLLYQDKTARRSLSTCSNLRFQNTGVQTEYVGKPLQFQTVQVEEKTIRMERSISESQQMNTLNNKQENANAATKETHRNGSNASPSRDAAATDAVAISPKGNVRRKARSSLFTTCICCTAAIS